MQNITINISKEIKIWLSVFVLCNLLNVASIIIYKTFWKELYTQLGFVFMLTCTIYLFVALVRGTVYLFRKKRH